MVGECQLRRDTRRQHDVETHSNASLRLGQVDFINCLPINFVVESGVTGVHAKLINAVPSELNKMILSNEIDIAPVSSLTYLENKNKLVPVGNLCIACDGPADSVLLFSKYPLDELNDSKVALSSASATSNKLLEIIFKIFLKLDVSFELEGMVNHAPTMIGSKYQAALHIGDDALIEFSKKPRNVFVYDLGSLWKKYTGLPMVFGMWAVRKEIHEKYLHEVKTITSQLKIAMHLGLDAMLDKVIRQAQEKVLLSKEFYQIYFKHLRYEFTDECRLGLDTFEKYCLLPAMASYSAGSAVT